MSAEPDPNRRNGIFSSDIGPYDRQRQRSRFHVTRLSQYFIAGTLLITLITIVGSLVLDKVGWFLGNGFAYSLAIMSVLCLFYFGCRLLRVEWLTNLVEFAIVGGLFAIAVFIAWEMIAVFSGYLDAVALWAIAALVGGVVFFFGSHGISQLRARRLGYG